MESAIVQALEKFTREVVVVAGVKRREGELAVEVSVSSSTDGGAAVVAQSSSSSSVKDEEIFNWVEQTVGSQFRQSGKKKTFSLVEFELGKDEPSEDDLDRSRLGEGMVIPLRVVYRLEGVRMSSQLMIRLPPYIYDFADAEEDEVSASSEPTARPMVTVHTHETYFYSTVLPDIKSFLNAEGVDLTFPIPDAVYVRHGPKYEAHRTPALIENVMRARTMLVLRDPKGEGFNELESVEDVGAQEGLAVMSELGKLHAVSWCMAERTGQGLSELWPGLVSVTDQAAVHHQVLERSFEFFTAGFDNENSELHKLYAQVLYRRPEMEGIVREALYAEGPTVPSALLHMMIGGPNLYFRRQSTQGDDRSSHATKRTDDDDDDDGDVVNCCIANWSLAAIGNPVLDLALFTTISLTPSMRQEYTDIFLDHYCQAFVSTASLFNLVPNFDMEYISQEFRKFHIWTTLFMIAASEPGDLSEDEMRDVMTTIIETVRSIKAESQL